MKLSKIKPNNYIKYLKESITNKCLFCLSENIKNKKCLDCGNDNSPIYYSERTIENKRHEMSLSFELSSKQKEASLFFLNSYKRKENATLLAVCGSGKTEVMYESILYALNEGKKVLITIPRKEIVSELYSRLKKVFIMTSIDMLDYSHHSDEGELIISTINQLINYEDEFDLIILDEADAFPYKGSDYLNRLLNKSRKKKSVLFSMSATIEKTKGNIFYMNRRYHEYDLDTPIFIRVKTPYLELITKIINEAIERKFIIYVPTIKQAKYYAKSLNIEACYSTNIYTKEIIEKMKYKNTRCIVSTTILERGITVNALDVIVIDADNKVFQKDTLIQICGRVGRSKEDPTGKIYILYRKNKLKFVGVKNYIRRMNHEMCHLQ